MKIIIRKYIIFCCISLFILFYTILIFEDYKKIDPTIIFTFFCIGVLSFINIITSLKYKFSLYKVHGYFFLIFLFLAPLHQYINQSFPWGWGIKEEIIIIGNIIITVWLIIFLIAYHITPPSKSQGQPLPINDTIIIIGFVLSIIAMLVTIYYVGGISNLFTRGAEGLTSLQSISLILGTAIRPFPVLYFSYLYIVFSEKKLSNNTKGLKALLIATFLIVMITNFPTAVSRYHAAAVYIGLLLLFLKKRLPFDIIFLIGIFVIFPTLELFRYSSIENVLSHFELQIIEFSTGHFDAYSMLMRTIELVIRDGPTYGFQLLGVLLFFVPRSFWVSKPFGSGAYVGDSLGLDFLNISSPFIAEMLINFGFVFFLVGPLFLGIFTKKSDTKYWGYNNSLRYINIYYIFLIGFFFFILRGDLLSSFAYTIGFYVPLLLLKFISKFRIS